MKLHFLKKKIVTAGVITGFPFKIELKMCYAMNGVQPEIDFVYFVIKINLQFADS